MQQCAYGYIVPYSSLYCKDLSIVPDLSVKLLSKPQISISDNYSHNMSTGTH